MHIENQLLLPCLKQPFYLEISKQFILYRKIIRIVSLHSLAYTGEYTLIIYTYVPTLSERTPFTELDLFLRISHHRCFVSFCRLPSGEGGGKEVGRGQREEGSPPCWQDHFAMRSSRWWVSLVLNCSQGCFVTSQYSPNISYTILKERILL